MEIIERILFGKKEMKLKQNTQMENIIGVKFAKFTRMEIYYFILMMEISQGV